jgi:transposase-like protein
MNQISCPKCSKEDLIKSGVIKGRQRFNCKSCNYSFTVLKQGKSIDPYYVIKSLQLYIEGISFREIERILGISHVSVMNWVKKYNIKAPENYEYRPSYKVLNHSELISYIQSKENLKNTGCVITEIGDKFMLIKWERFRKNSF